MRLSPYRLAAERPPEEPQQAPTPCDVDLAPILGLFWVCSVARVALGLSQGETFGIEPTLALMAVVGLPFLGRDFLRNLMSRKARNSSQ